jgi:hypothetical protein
VRNFWPILPLILAGVLLCGSAGSADEIVLANGARLQGKVLNPKCPKCKGGGRQPCRPCGGKGEVRAVSGKRVPCPACRGGGRVACGACQGLGVVGGKVRIKLGSGVLTELNSKEIKSISWKHIDPERLIPVQVSYQKRLAKTDARSAEAQFKLGVWCLENKLFTAARKHLAAAARLDARMYGKRVAPYLREMDRKREKAAVKAMLAALALFERKRPEEGAAAIRRLQRSYPDSGIVRRAELQRDLIREHFPKLLAAGTDTLEKLLSKVADRAAAECPTCKGTGRRPCATCRGTGVGKCGACSGSGGRVCPVCKGSLRLTCPKCHGRGKAQGGTIGYGSRHCPGCGGAGELACDFCAAKGIVACRVCRGSKQVPRGCGSCRGTGMVSCSDCLGSGVRRVSKLRWGPPPVRRAGVINVVGPGARSRAWQGSFFGATITVVPAAVIWRGALARNVADILGREVKVFAVALDNRRGRKLLRFRPGGNTARAVTRGADQVGMLDMARLLSARKSRRAGPLVKVSSSADCLPGAYVSVLLVLPETTDMKELASFFWVQGSGEPSKLGPIWLSSEEVTELRKSLK